jgi:hypothetical protein
VLNSVVRRDPAKRKGPWKRGKEQYRCLNCTFTFTPLPFPFHRARARLVLPVSEPFTFTFTLTFTFTGRELLRVPLGHQPGGAPKVQQARDFTFTFIFAVPFLRPVSPFAPFYLPFFLPLSSLLLPYFWTRVSSNIHLKVSLDDYIHKQDVSRPRVHGGRAGKCGRFYHRRRKACGGHALLFHRGALYKRCLNTCFNRLNNED